MSESAVSACGLSGLLQLLVLRPGMLRVLGEGQETRLTERDPMR
jgi:hypothetical protein